MGGVGTVIDGGEGEDTLNLTDISKEDWDDGVKDNFENFEKVNFSDGTSIDLDKAATYHNDTTTATTDDNNQDLSFNFKDLLSVDDDTNNVGKLLGEDNQESSATPSPKGGENSESSPCTTPAHPIDQLNELSEQGAAMHQDDSMHHDSIISSHDNHH